MPLGGHEVMSRDQETLARILARGVDRHLGEGGKRLKTRSTVLATERRSVHRGDSVAAEKPGSVGTTLLIPSGPLHSASPGVTAEEGTL